MQTRKYIYGFAAGLMLGALSTGCVPADDGFEVTESVGRTYAPLVGAEAENAIPDQYIIVFNDDVSIASKNAAMNRIDQRGINRVERTYSVINGFSARLDSNAVEQLRRDPSVAYIEQDQIIELDAVYPSPADGIDRVDQREGRDGNYDDHGLDGTGVHVYIVDTGIRTTHNEFTGRMGNGFSSISGGFEDCNGHGSHVASTAAGTQFGMAKGATLHAVRVLGCNGSGSTAGVISGVDFVADDCGNQNGPCVANMSLGGGASSSLDNAVANAVAAGVPFAVAAGNSNNDACGSSPAREPSAITVAATADNDSRASFSSFGSCVDIFAPGVSILGADIGNDNDTQSISGTSMASPHVAGAIAQFLQANPNATPAEVEVGIEDAASTNCVNDPRGTPNLFLHNDFDAAAFDCGGDPNPDPDPGPGDPNSCAGHCGTSAPGGCSCNFFCLFFGGCCGDFIPACF